MTQSGKCLMQRDKLNDTIRQILDAAWQVRWHTQSNVWWGVTSYGGCSNIMASILFCHLANDDQAVCSLSNWGIVKQIQFTQTQVDPRERCWESASDYVILTTSPTEFNWSMKIWPPAPHVWNTLGFWKVPWPFALQKVKLQASRQKQAHMLQGMTSYTTQSNNWRYTVNKVGFW